MTSPAVARGALRLRRAIERIGPYSPFVTGGTFSPAARRLLADGEAGTERVLHLLRLVMFVVATLVAFLVFDLTVVLRDWWPLMLTVTLGFIVLWTAVWRRLARGGASAMGLRVGLVFFDGFVIDRGVLLFQNPGGLYSRLVPDLYANLLRLFTPRDVDAITPPMLVLLALTGAMRLDPRLALLTTAVALAVYAHLRIVMPATPAQTWLTALIIGFAGLLGANVARVFRYVAWKASQETVLERYVPQSLTQEMLRSGDPERAPRVETITVLISDVRGFTRLAERLSPAESVALLNACFDTLVAPLARAGGVLDKYIGDGMLAFFEGPDHASRALAAARAMLTALDAFNAARAGEPLRIGIAIHGGETLVGSVGASGRRDYTVIGDVVNVTARLEECNKRLGSALVVSEDALALMRPEARDGLAGPTRLEIRGREAGIVAYHLGAPA